MLQPGCQCCDCPACTRCTGTTKPTRWVLSMSGMSNSGSPCGCVTPGLPIDCTRQHGDYVLYCRSVSAACEWGDFDRSIPSICSDNPVGSTSFSLSYFSGAFYLVFGAALYKYVTTGVDCSVPMVLTYSTDFGYPVSPCCSFPGSVTLTPG